jgi:hypothetical protein
LIKKPIKISISAEVCKEYEKSKKPKKSTSQEHQAFLHYMGLTDPIGIGIKDPYEAYYHYCAMYNSRTLRLFPHLELKEFEDYVVLRTSLIEYEAYVEGMKEANKRDIKKLNRHLRDLREDAVLTRFIIECKTHIEDTRQKMKEGEKHAKKMRKYLSDMEWLLRIKANLIDYDEHISGD